MHISPNNTCKVQSHITHHRIAMSYQEKTRITLEASVEVIYCTGSRRAKCAASVLAHYSGYFAIAFCWEQHLNRLLNF